MVVIVQLLAPDPYAPGKDVGACLAGLPTAVAPEMPDTVDDTGRPERNPSDLHHQNQQARDQSKQKYIYRSHQEQSQHAMGGVEIALDPVIGRAVTVAFNGLANKRFLDIQEHPQPQHLVQAQDLRAVRIVDGLAFGVVLAMDCGPLLGHHAGCQPKPEAKKMARQGMQLQ